MATGRRSIKYHDLVSHCHCHHGSGRLKTRWSGLLLLAFVRFLSVLSFPFFLSPLFVFFWTGSRLLRSDLSFRPQAQDDLFCGSQQFWPVCPGQFTALSPFRVFFFLLSCAPSFFCYVTVQEPDDIMSSIQGTLVYQSGQASSLIVSTSFASGGRV